MRIFLAVVTVLLASCASTTQPLATETVVLRGTPGTTMCRTSEPYSGSFAALRLVEPLDFGSLRGATEVELIMGEADHVQYGRYIGKQALVSCKLSESFLCGYPQITCGVSAISVEP